MIVDPDFPDHWKTRLLVNLLDGDESAPMYVIRLWAHCQNRRANKFQNLTSSALKALCRYPGHPTKLESCLVSSGFVRRESTRDLIVHEWEQYNASLIANWENGKRGGRPPKTEKGKPKGNPKETHGLAMANPNETDKSRVDKNKALSPRTRGDQVEESPPVMLPTREAVQNAARMAGISQDIADMFFDSAESRPLTPDGGWTRHNGQPMAMDRWHHALSAFAASVQRNQQSGRSGAKPKMKGQSKYANAF